MMAPPDPQEHVIYQSCARQLKPQSRTVNDGDLPLLPLPPQPPGCEFAPKPAPVP